MPAPTLIDYATFLANAQAEDIRALAFLAGGEPVKTASSVEADTFQAQGVRLYDAGCLIRFRRSLEVIGNETWHVFEGIVHPGAMSHVAQCAMERVMLSRTPIQPQG